MVGYIEMDGLATARTHHTQNLGDETTGFLIVECAIEPPNIPPACVNSLGYGDKTWKMLSLPKPTLIHSLLASSTVMYRHETGEVQNPPLFPAPTRTCPVGTDQ